MELEVYWVQFAENKLWEIYNYYKLNAGVTIAKKIVNGIVDTTTNLKQYPKIGQIEIYLSNRDEEFRYLVYKNYKIIYWVNLELSRIEIVNIFDVRQSPEKIKQMK